MSFDRRDIRPSMDVYTLDNVYLGSVVRVLPGPPALGPAGASASRAAADGASAMSGELLGPAPTLALGNRGPVAQGAEAAYGAARDGAEAIGRGGAIVVGRWWGLVGRRTIPLDAVLSVSMERVVLRQAQHELARSALAPETP